LQAPSLGEPGQGIHDEQDTGALVAEVLGYGSCKPAAVQAHQRRGIRRRGDNDGALPVRRAEDAFDELLHLATALADQADYNHVRTRVTSHHAEQDTLAYAAAGKQADSLPSSDGQQ
jgi:hypothetical protein